MSINLLEYSLTKTRHQIISDIIEQSSSDNNDNNNNNNNHDDNNYDDQRKLIYTFAMKKVTIVNHAFDQELSRRKLALLLYLIRSPVFDRSIQYS